MRPIGWVVSVLLAVGCSGTGGTDAGSGGSGGSGGGSAGASGGSGGGSAGGSGGSGGGSAGGSGGSGAGGGAGGGTAGGAGGGGVVTGTPYVYVSGGGGIISIFKLDVGTGGLADAGSVIASSNPSFLAVDPAKRNLYAANEGSKAVSAFAINPANGMLSPLNSQPSQGDEPTHVSVDQTGRWVFVANYTSGSVAVFPVRPDGGLGLFSDTDNSGANAHQILTDPTNKFVVVPTLGDNRVVQYLFNADAGTLTNNGSMATDGGAGPRHLAFHPGGKFAYLINELSSTMEALAFSAAGQLTPLQKVSTLPAGVGGANTTAEVFVHPNGQFLYGSNRGHNSIVAFSLDQTAGLMTLIGHTPTGGNTPRNFAIDPGGSVLLVANQNSGTITSFRINVLTGALTSLGQTKAVSSPAFVGVVYLP